MTENPFLKKAGVNPFLAKARAASKGRAKALLMLHLRDLQALDRRIEDGEVAKPRIQAKLAECREALRHY